MKYLYVLKIPIHWKDMGLMGFLSNVLKVLLQGQYYPRSYYKLFTISYLFSLFFRDAINTIWERFPVYSGTLWYQLDRNFGWTKWCGMRDPRIKYQTIFLSLKPLFGHIVICWISLLGWNLLQMHTSRKKPTVAYKLHVRTIIMLLWNHMKQLGC